MADNIEESASALFVIQPDENWRFNFTGTPKFVWLVVSNSGEPITNIKIDEESKYDISITKINNTNYHCEWQGQVEEGQHTVTIETYKNGGVKLNEVSFVFGIFNLIFDRTISDVRRIQYLSSKIQENTNTEDELAEWRFQPKGAYNAKDLNRVAWTEYFIKRLSENYGYNISVVAKRDWDYTDKPTPYDAQNYINDIKTIYELPHSQNAPQVPTTLEHFNYEEANNIEKILRDVQLTMTRAKISWFSSGEIACGE